MMMRFAKYILTGLLFIGFSVTAQELTVRGTSPDLYLNHQVEAKETWYSLGRMYNLSPRDIASYNRLTIETGLSIGQEIKIPLKSANFSQNEVKAADEVFVPVIHTVQEREWMYRISVNHNKVPVETLERWNNISRDNAVMGTKLIVGYLKVKPNQSPLASMAAQVGAPVAQNRIAAPVQEEPVPREAPKKESASQETPLPAAEKAPVTNTAATATETRSAAANAPSGPIPQGGYFRNQFNNSGKQNSGISGVFKSTSGWKDGKYYALMNDVPVGTIIRVNFPSTNRTIFAKVLGQLPDMRESEGLTIRLSDAAASELGAGYQKFTVDLRY